MSSDTNSLSYVDVLEQEFDELHRDEPADSSPESWLKQRSRAEPGSVPVGSASELPSGEEQERLAALFRAVHALPERRTALCLSGGGIRSATFSLGVLQGLARNGWLDKFHYLSTVSGGGYIGSWLSSWLARVKNRDKVIDDLTQEHEPDRVRALRSYSNYLSPVWGLSGDKLTLFFTFIRNLLLQWCVFIPLLLVAVLLPWWNMAMLGYGEDRFIQPLLLVGGFLVVLGIAYLVYDLPEPEPPPGTMAYDNRRDLFKELCFWPIVVAAIGLSWAWWWAFNADEIARPAWQIPLYPQLWARDGSGLILAVGGALVHFIGVAIGGTARHERVSASGLGASKWWHNLLDILFVLLSGAAGGYLLHVGAAHLLADDGFFMGGDGRVRYATFGVPLLISGFCVASILYAALSRPINGEGSREWGARAGAWWLAFAVAWILAHALVIYIPQSVHSLLRSVYTNQDGILKLLLSPESLGAGGVLSGLAAAVFGYLSKSGAQRSVDRAPSAFTLAGRRLLDILSLVFILLLLLFLSFLAHRLLDPYSKTTQRSVHPYVVAQPEVTAAVADAPVPVAFDAANSDELATLSITGQAEPYKPQLSKADTWLLDRLEDYRYVLHGVEPASVLALMGIAALIGVIFSFFVGANTFSLHAMYGNRLCRAYLGAARHRRDPHPFTGFDPKDDIVMCDLVGGKGQRQRGSREPAERTRLFHIVNVTLNLAKAAGTRLQWQERKAASFTMSPLHSGSRILGYRNADEYSQRISLGRAMAISGAAASPNMGYHTSPFVGFVMTLLNVRLGWWLPNTGEVGRGRWNNKEPGSGLRPLIDEAFVSTSDASKYVYLSDGGHFDNLGLYEMVLRRCHLIVVVDAGADSKYQYEDLENVIRRVRVDLGISIDFPGGLPGRDAGPNGPMHWVAGKIRYSEVDPVARGEKPDANDGVIIYVKPVLSPELPLDVRSYARKTAESKSPFPHQATTDQFFDEAQFESYRVLGLHSALTLRDIRLQNGKVALPILASKTAAELAAPEVSAAGVLVQPEVEKKEQSLTAGWFSRSSIPGWLALVGALSFAATAQPEGPVTPVVPIIQQTVAVPPVLIVPPEEDADSFTLALFDEARRCNADASKCEVGVEEPMRGFNSLIQDVASELASCARGEPIRLEAKGYASTSDFRPAPDSDEKNLRVANGRASAVEELLRRALKERGVENYHPRPGHFTSYEEMSRSRRYVDNKPKYDELRASLNRRVDISLLSPTSCSLSKIATKLSRSRITLAAQ